MPALGEDADEAEFARSTKDLWQASHPEGEPGDRAAFARQARASWNASATEPLDVEVERVRRIKAAEEDAARSRGEPRRGDAGR